MGDKIEIDIYDNIQSKPFRKQPSKPHNGPITKIDVSPNGKYLVTYSQFDSSIFGWKVEDISEGKLEPDNKTIKINLNIFSGKIEQICVSDDKKLAYIRDKRLGIIDMKNNETESNLQSNARYCTFNLKGELIVYGILQNRATIWIYSARTKNGKWVCKRTYEIRKDSKFIGTSRDGKLYFTSNNFIYECNILADKSIRMFCNYENNENNVKLMNKISSNERFTCLKTKNKITIHSIVLDIPIASLDINNGKGAIQNCIMRNCWKRCLDQLKQDNKLPDEYQTEDLPNLPYNIQTTGEYAYGILDGYVWKIKLEEKIPKMDFTSENSDEIIENWYFEIKKMHETHYKTYEYLTTHLLNPYYMSIRYEDISAEKFKGKNMELSHNLIKWKIEVGHKNCENINLRVYKKINVSSDKWNLICNKKGIEKCNICYKPKLLNDNHIILLTTTGIYIYYFNEVIKSISLSYFYYMNLDKYSDDVEKLQDNYKKVLSNQILPLPNYDSFKLNDRASYIIDNKESLLIYGTELLSFAIKEHKLELIDKIYKKCLSHFEKDLGNNRMFLSIISCMMPLLNKYYPEYISKYSIETNLIIDSPFYNIKHQNDNLHLYSFQVINLTQSSKFKMLCYNYGKTYYILNTIQQSITQLTSFFNKISTRTTNSTIPTIIFMVPYIKFINYPQIYKWSSELIKPQPSPFIETINKNIYKTWNGEALINFKWNTYGIYYYMIIWIMFLALLGCFTAVATIPQLYNNEDIRKQLLITSIILGFIHLSFEIRQIIYNPIEWIYDFWNLFDIIAYLLPICTSIIWLQTNDRNDHVIQLLSFSCLFLDIKFLLFFRAFESFGVYFAIIISVGRQIIAFLLVLFIIIISFAHAFYILLLPKSDVSFDKRIIDDDPNNPWNIVPTYNQVFENGSIDSNPFIIQPPNENTNMFIDFKTALFAMYKFLTGDSSALSNWSYSKDPSLAILIVLFSLLIVVYLMNLFIGLLNNAIDKDNDRVSYLIQKAKILAEIELFYLLPNQRRWKTWFPEVIHYYADVDKTREMVKEMISKGEWNTKEFPKLKEDLLDKLNIQPVDEVSLRNLLEEIQKMQSKL
ncbi:hypothetical protein GLOIN_2v1874127 [Rhizophagus clarus]|uniref:Ion transport domain-containing protein n=1 Tax=Rhizophagus clarus TaxID=94130 RepID=A0A8H3QND0_9GLOM|nr:hypothetical protein GLOIN_2v1874127 [Rhizophagus clarus]